MFWSVLCCSFLTYVLKRFFQKKKLYSIVQMRTSTANTSQRIKTTASWEAEKRESTFDKSDGWILSLTGRRGWILYPKMSKSNLNRFEKEETPLLRIIRDEAQEVLRWHNGGITSDVTVGLYSTHGPWPGAPRTPTGGPATSAPDRTASNGRPVNLRVGLALGRASRRRRRRRRCLCSRHGARPRLYPCQAAR